MVRLNGSGTPAKVPVQQADAVLSQANPVSDTEYTILDTTKNVEIDGIAVNVTWATTQPTPLLITVYIDGKTIIHTQANPVSTQNYIPLDLPNNADANQVCKVTAGTYIDQLPKPLYKGRSVKVTMTLTWATTQPTPLVCRVKYAKW